MAKLKTAVVQPEPYDCDITILGTPYKLHFRNVDDNNGVTFNQGRLAGYCDTDNKECFVCLSQSDEQQKLTVMHECIHAFLHEGGLVRYCNDEILVSALEVQLPKMARLFKNIGVLDL